MNSNKSPTFQGNILQSRISFVIFVFGALWLLLILKGAYLQLIPQPKLSQLKRKLFDRTVELKPKRGNIYDRNHKELAISIPSQSLFADPSQMTEPYYAAKKLSQLLNQPKKALLKKLLNKNRRFVWIKRHLSEQEAKTIKSWRLEGLHFLKESKRFYTNKDSLSQVLGFTGVEGQGLEGIEKQYDEILTGESQKVLIQRDARGRPLFKDFSPFIEKVSGYDVHLTIDSRLQFYLEKVLEKGRSQSEALSAMGIILSAQTAEILAMANIPNYNPNQIKKSLAETRRNRTVTDLFEPGSTLKTFTIISALQQGIDPKKNYPSHDGRLEIDSHVIKEANPKKKFKEFLNLTDILALSSNIGASLVALELGDKNLRKTLKDFGFGSKTGVDFPGESSGLLKKPPWRDIETATISFGHGMASTALQMANAYTTIASGGVLKQPRLVKKISNPYTGEEQVFETKRIRKVLDKKTAQALILKLMAVTEQNGTGFLAQVPGYFTAGKTGTAQKVNLESKGYKKGEYISSFAGFIPAHKPQFVIYLVVDGAKKNFYASHLTAPLFAELASYTLRQAEIAPTILKEENIVRQIAGIKKDSDKSFDSLSRSHSKSNFIMPQLEGQSLRQVLNALSQKNVPLKIQGSGYLVKSQPAPGEPIPKGTKIILTFR